MELGLYDAFNIFMRPGKTNFTQLACSVQLCDDLHVLPTPCTNSDFLGSQTYKLYKFFLCQVFCFVKGKEAKMAPPRAPHRQFWNQNSVA